MINRFEHGGNIYKINREHGICKKDILDFSANINPLGISELGKNAYFESINDLMHYPDPDYMNLRMAISNYHNTKLDYIYTGNGAIEMIYKLFNYLMPKRALIVAPTFVEYEKALNTIDARVDFLILKKEDNFTLDMESLKCRAKDYELLVFCSPNNPTGKIVEKEKIIELLGYIEANDLECKVFLDEAFIDFISEESSMISFIDKYKGLYILRSATKFFAIPGLRIGYLISSDEDFRLFYEKYQVPWSINTLAENVLIASLSDKEYIKATVEANQKNREYLYSELKKISELEVYSSMASYIFFKSRVQIDLRKELLAKSILIRSCSNYVGLDEAYYRVAVKGHKDNIRLIKALKEVFNND